MMQCTSIFPAGAQQWNVDVADACGTRAAYCATLAVYIYDIAEQPRLERILSHSDRTILSLAWCPTDPNTIAMSIAEEGHNICIWDVDASAVTKRLATGVGAAKYLAWNPLAGSELIAGTGEGRIVQLDIMPVATSAIDEVAWASRVAGCGSDSLSTKASPKLRAMRVNHRISRRYALGFEKAGLVHVVTANMCTMDCIHKDESVVDLQWDPLSDSYLLVGLVSGTVHMYDVESSQQLQTFDSCGPGLKSIAWVPGVPGDFVTVTDKTSLLRLWNVSHRSPRSIIKADAGPFQGASFIQPTQRILCRFKSGAVGICDLQTRSWSMFGRSAHTDTVFGAAFKPADPNILATCSFDGSVRVWDLGQSTLHRDLQDEDVGVLYSVAWAPHDETQLVTVSSKGQALIWDVENSILLQRVKVVEDVPNHTTILFSCDWCHGADGLIACAADNGCVTLLRPNGNLILRLRHPSSTYGVSWHAKDPNVFATSCKDAIVRVHRIVLPRSGVGQISASDTKLVGHTARVFGVLFSPLLPHLLLSGSDDTTVRVWDTTSNTHRVLSGHTQNVRALQWSHEVPWLAFSGAWDGTIRVWDTRACTALCVLNEHNADVYAIASHPQRPGVMLSTSRDTTIRTWTLDHTFSAILLPLILFVGGSSFKSASSTGGIAPLLTADVHTEMISTAALPQGCTGFGSHLLAERLKEAIETAASRVELFAIIFNFFHAPRGMPNFWSLLSRLERSGEVLNLRAKLEVHSSDDLLEKARAQLALLMIDKDRTTSRLVGEGASRRRVKQEDRLRMAAALSLQLGEMRQYCELLVQLGEWLHAIAISPTVSLAYWQELCGRHANHLASQAAEPAVLAPFLLGAGDSRAAVRYLLSRREYDEAQMLAAIHSNLSPIGEPAASVGIHQSFHADQSRMVEEVLMARANTFNEEGEPVLAACCYLAHGQPARAVKELIRAHVLEVALTLALTLNLPDLHMILRMLSARAEKLKQWSLALTLLQRSRDAQTQTVLLAARCLRSSSSQVHQEVDLFVEASLPPATSYRQLAETAQRGGNAAEAIRCYVVTGDVQAAAEIALPLISQCFRESFFDVAGAQALLEPFRGAALDETSGLSPVLRAAVLAWSTYEALLQAMWRGYAPILLPLHSAATELSAQAATAPDGFQGPTPTVLDLLRVQLFAYFVRSRSHPNALTAMQHVLDERITSGGMTPALVKAVSLLKALTPSEQPSNTYSRPILARSEALPSSGGGVTPRATCFFTGTRMTGPSVTVDSSGRAMPLSLAIMWAKLHPFSPTHTGERMCPF